MSEETLKKLNDIHLLYSMPYKVENMRAEHYAINEYEKLVYSQIKEIERLKIQVSARETEYERLHSIIKEVREMRNYLSNKYYEMGEEVDMGVIIEHLDRILNKVGEE